MSWAGIASNQTISCNNLQDAVSTGALCLKSAIPVSNKQITKSEADGYVYLYPDYPSFAAKASNQLVVKKDLPNMIGYGARYGDTAYRTFDGGYSWENISPGGSIVIADIACSSTGNYVTILLENGYIYYSSNYGSSWTNISFTPNASTRIDMSKNGQYQTYCRYGDYLYRSTNWGANWAQVTSAGARNWYAIAISGSGQYQTAGDASSSGYIYRSTNYGVSFTAITGAGARYWIFGAAMSSDGQYQFIIGNDGITPPFTSRVYRSDNYGVTWTAIQTLQYKRSIACSTSGQYVIIGTDGGQVWISSDYGDNWTQANLYPSGSTVWDGVAVSATGQYMMAGNVGGSTFSYYSSDYGASWSQSSLGAMPFESMTLATESCYINTTTTTTTTIAPAYDYYLADEYDCSSCILQGTDVLVGFEAGTSVTLNRFYPDVDVSGFVYRVRSSTSAGSPAILLQNVSSTSCAGACSL